MPAAYRRALPSLDLGTPRQRHHLQTVDLSTPHQKATAASDSTPTARASARAWVKNWYLEDAALWDDEF